MSKLFLLLLIITTFNLKAETLKKILSHDVANHSTAKDCWIIIDKNVYDLSNYLPKHEKYTDTLPKSCGKDGTILWHTKGEKNKEHSKKAKLYIQQFLIGTID